MIVSEVFSLVCELGIALGVRNINTLVGCWEHQVDEHWAIALNAHDHEVECSHGTKVPGFCCYLQFNGWPAGFVGPQGGTMAAGSIANENLLCDALRNAIEKAKVAC